MSDNKSKYYLTTLTAVVRANSKRDALEYIKNGKYFSNTGAIALTVEVDATRISAVEARVKTV